MSYYECPNCHNKHAVFGESHIDSIAKEKNVTTVSKMPIDTDLAVAMDKGLVEECAPEALNNMVEMLKNLPEKKI